MTTLPAATITATEASSVTTAVAGVTGTGSRSAVIADHPAARVSADPAFAVSRARVPRSCCG